MMIIAGDFNAEVQASQEDDFTHAVGRFANPCGNSRDDWMTRWATAEKFILCNTKFKKRWGKLWTHRQRDRQRQIDFICIDAKFWKLVRDSESCKHVDLGSDHRAVNVTLDISCLSIKKRRYRQKASNVG